MISFKVSGNWGEASHEARMRMLRIRTNVINAVRKGSFAVQAQAQRHLTGPYLKVDTGRLRSSVQTMLRLELKSILGIVGTNVWYGKLWETGEAISGGKTVTLKRRARRPWLSDAMERKRELILRYLQQGIRDALEGSKGESGGE